MEKVLLPPTNILLETRAAVIRADSSYHPGHLWVPGTFVCLKRDRGNTSRVKTVAGAAFVERGDTVSESEHQPGRSEEEVAIETFVDRIKEIHPDLNREELQETISRYVQEAVEDAEGEDGSEDEEE